ncbi:MAG: TetR/AcrR family transcriptional regulator [Nocardioidaceae bacterium]
MVSLPNDVRRTKRREATRQEILAAGWEIAREVGLAGLTLREVAARVGMQAPSLYSHFASKNAIYDAMYGQAWTQFLDCAELRHRTLPEDPRRALLTIAETFFDFAGSDLARYQLMNQRTVPGFQPSEAAYLPAIETVNRLADALRRVGVDDPSGTDLFTALVGGLVDQQLANEPHGDRWRRLLPRVIDMYSDATGLPRSRQRRTA